MPVDCCAQDGCERRVWTTDASTDSWCGKHPSDAPSHARGYQRRQVASVRDDYHRQRIVDNGRGER